MMKIHQFAVRGHCVGINKGPPEIQKRVKSRSGFDYAIFRAGTLPGIVVIDFYETHPEWFSYYRLVTVEGARTAGRARRFARRHGISGWGMK
jgi:hypothetical protein